MNKYCFKKVWWVFLLLVLFLLPIGINSLYLCDAWCSIFEIPSEWTKFWGGYLGAIISGIVAFIILYIQRKDNELQNKENKIQNQENRQQNKLENEANRRLAIYQMEKQRIDDVRNVYTQYMTLVNTNDLLELALKIQQDSPTLITDLRKPNDEFRKAKILVSLYPLKDTNNAKTFIQERSDFEKSYHATLNDFDKLIRWCKYSDPTFITQDSEKLKEISVELRNIIKTTKQDVSIREFIYECASRLVKEHAKEAYNNMHTSIQNYIKEELKDLDLFVRQ